MRHTTLFKNIRYALLCGWYNLIYHLKKRRNALSGTLALLKSPFVYACSVISAFREATSLRSVNYEYYCAAVLSTKEEIRKALLSHRVIPEMPKTTI